MKTRRAPTGCRGSGRVRAYRESSSCARVLLDRSVAGDSRGQHRSATDRASRSPAVSSATVAPTTPIRRNNSRRTCACRLRVSNAVAVPRSRQLQSFARLPVHALSRRETSTRCGRCSQSPTAHRSAERVHALRMRHARQRHHRSPQRTAHWRAGERARRRPSLP